jgi:hypothetical protein
MTPDSGETLSMLVDGELVEPEMLERALSEPDGPETLIAFVRLRGQFEPDAAVPGADFYRSAQTALAADTSPSAPWRTFAMGIASVLVALAVGAGAFVAGQHQGRSAVSVSLVGIYCTDAGGQLHSVGSVRSVAGHAQECVLKGTWVPAGR